MDTVTEISRAKLNLSLDVLAKRADGYHDLRMVMGSVAFGDEVTVSLRTDGETVCRSDLPWLPTDRRNLAVRAAEAFFAAVGEEYPGAEIRMVKHVPVGAGMAGGSANAAAVLRALNTLTASGLDAETLRRIGLEIGSDVPYCVSGGMALAEGRGERLTPLPPLPECHIVICKPAFSISTAELFSRIDSRAVRTHPDTAGLIGAMERGDLGGHGGTNVQCVRGRIAPERGSGPLHPLGSAGRRRPGGRDDRHGQRGVRAVRLSAQGGGRPGQAVRGVSGLLSHRHGERSIFLNFSTADTWTNLNRRAIMHHDQKGRAPGKETAMRLRNELGVRNTDRFLLSGDGMGEVCQFACGIGNRRRGAAF